jgi:sugar phosphate isomerase/epimerase
MVIGVKLDIGFRENESCRRLFGTDDPLEFLSNLGVRAVETAVGVETNFEALGEYTRQCAAAGLRVSLHPYSELTPFNPANFGRRDGRCRCFHTRVFLAAEEAAERQGRETMVNIHGAAEATGGERARLLDESIRFFTWAREWCAENAPHVAVVSELQFRPFAHETIQRIGDGYEELMRLVTRAEIGACLDTGHAFMNTERFGDPVEPPEELLKKIVHVHCHDVREIDHYPLVFDKVPWQQLLSSAVAGGFDGAVILEVPPEHYLRAGGLDTLVRSIEKLKDFARFRTIPSSGTPRSS